MTRAILAWIALSLWRDRSVTQFNQKIWTASILIIVSQSWCIIIDGVQHLAVNGTELTEWEWHATCSQQFDSRYNERITRYTVISSHLTIYYVFAVIKTEVSSWIPFHVKQETYIPIRFVALLGNQGTGCRVLSDISYWTGCTCSLQRTFRQPAVNRDSLC